jgi:HTH-type transcriptional regulator, competence development regulator
MMTLKEYRIRAGINLVRAEYLTGISNAYLSRLENGRVKNPGVQIMYTLSKLYKVDLVELITNTGIVSESYNGRIKNYNPHGK